MVTNIIFDIGNVLVSFQWADLAEEIGFTKENVRVMNERVIGDRWNELDRGVMSEKDAIDYIKEGIPGMEEKFDELWSRIDEAIYPYEYSKPWIKRLKEEGYGVYLLSNFPRELFTRLSKTKMPFLPYVDGEVISAFVKMIKPDAAIYEHLMKEYRLKPEECIFIDDRPANVESAKALGMQGLLFTGYESADAYLKRMNPEDKG